MSFWDIVGGPYFNRNLGILKKDGRLVIIGFMGGRIAHEVDIQTLMLKRATITRLDHARPDGGGRNSRLPRRCAATSGRCLRQGNASR
ncbi:Quinone oxidoreductase [Klebsiella pneumoniae]|uniref:Quinone oxidoreductase n=1 Tax=Klebsiella pneumoniae TaxID=573 RepID=A0A378F737_KLEPN|nr:Quinone oxidoreductase [Klebsiella pneumoniae]